MVRQQQGGFPSAFSRRFADSDSEPGPRFGSNPNTLSNPPEVLKNAVISFARVDLVLASRVYVEPVAELNRQISRPGEVTPLERVR